MLVQGFLFQIISSLNWMQVFYCPLVANDRYNGLPKLLVHLQHERFLALLQL